MWNIYSHLLADAQVGIIGGFVLHIIVTGWGRA